MRFRMALAAMLVAIAGGAQTVRAQQSTPAAPVPAQANEARNQIQNWLHDSISQMPDTEYLRNGIAAADVSRAKACVVQAIVADIPDEPARKIADSMSQGVRDKAVEDWIFAVFKRGTERRRQALDQIKQLCPEFEKAM